MAKRRPLRGYNHNVRHAGHLYHVQTEDSGPGRAQLTTHIFYQGVILGTARSSYGEDTPEEVVLRLMQGQHKTALKQLRDGVFDEKAAALRAMLDTARTAALSTPAEVPSPAEAPPPMEARGAAEAPAEPSTPPVYTPSPLTDAELAELVDLAAGSLEGPGPAFSQSSYQAIALVAETPDEPEQVLELEAEPPSEDELLLIHQEAAQDMAVREPPVPSQETPSRTALYASARSPRRIAVWAPTGGYMPREHPSAPPAPSRESEDLPAEPTRVRLPPSHRGAGRPPGRLSRTTARRLDASPFRPRPTAEGVVIQRPLIITDQGRLPSVPASPAPRVPQVSSEEGSLEQVILAYLAEDRDKEK